MSPPRATRLVRAAPYLLVPDVMFRRAPDRGRITPVERQGGTWDVFYWVEGLDALRADLVKRGAKLAYDLTLQQYGMREFAVRDLDGHVLGFGEPTA